MSGGAATPRRGSNAYSVGPGKNRRKTGKRPSWCIDWSLFSVGAGAKDVPVGRPAHNKDHPAVAARKASAAGRTGAGPGDPRTTISYVLPLSRIGAGERRAANAWRVVPVQFYL